MRVIFSRTEFEQVRDRSTISKEASPMTETMWKCDQLRAGQLYNRMMFDSKSEAEQFASKMRQMEPDQTFAIEAVAASQVWN
jgi:hypothetical protein